MKTRLLCIVLVIVLCVGMLPVGALAAEEESTTEVLTEETAEASTEETTEEAPEETESPSTTETEEVAEETTEETVEEAVEETAVSLDGDDDVAASGSCGTNLTWTLDADGVLTISGTGDMTDYTSQNAVPWYYYRTLVVSVVIELGVTSVGKYAFYECTALTSVSLPDSVTKMGEYAFAYCSALTGIAIPNSVRTLEYSVFRYCTGLVSIVIPDNVTKIERSAFYYCSGLTSVTIPDSVTEIGEHAFQYCKSIADVYITNIAAWCGITFDSADSNPLSHVANLYVDGEMATDIVIPDDVSSIGNWAFRCCISLTSVEISDSVTSIGRSAFYHCTNLTSATLPNCLLSIGEYAFEETALSSIIIPDSVTTIGEGAFQNCSNLMSVELPTGISKIADYLFYMCSSLESVIIPDGVASIGGSAFKVCSNLTSVTIPNGVTSIGGSAFQSCSSLTDVTIPNNVKSIGTHAFHYCSSLTCIEIPDSVTSIGNWAFGKCTALTSATIGRGVTSIGESVFRYCSSLASVSIPYNVTSINSYAFQGCDKLKAVYYAGSEADWDEVTIHSNNDCLTSATIHYNWAGDGNETTVVASGTCGEDLTWTLDSDGVLNISGTGAMEDYSYDSNPPWYSYGDDILSVLIETGVTSIGDRAFYLCCEELESITIPDSVTKIGADAFEGCTSLTSITIPDGITNIEAYAFAKCSSFTNITVPNGVTSIEEAAFYGCTALEYVTIGSGVTCIGYGAFEACTSLVSITIPDGVTNIEKGAFYGCTALAKVYYRGTEEQWNEIDIGSYNDCLTGATIYYNCYLTINLSAEKISDFYAYETSDDGKAYYQSSYVYEITAEIENHADVTVENVTATLDLPDELVPIDAESLSCSLGDIPAREVVCTTWTVYADWPDESVAAVYGVAANVNQTATLYQEDYIYLEAKNENDNSIIFGIDQWRFPNSGDYFTNGATDENGDYIETYYITGADYKALISNLSNSEIERVNSYQNWGGSCHGMSVTAVLTKMGVIQPDDIVIGSPSLYSIGKTNNDDVESFINFYHVQWETTLNKNAVSDFMLKSKKTQLAQIEDMASRVSTGGYPFVLVFMGIDWAHSVVAYGVEHGDYSKYDSRILLYDCNYPDETTYLYYNTGTDEWKFQNYSNAAKFELACNDISILDYVNHGTAVSNYYAQLFFEGAVQQYSLLQDGQTTLIDASTDDRENGLVTYFDPNLMADGTYAESSMTLILPDLTGDYSVIPEEGACDFTLYYENTAVSAACDGAAQIDFGADGGVSASGVSGEYTLSLTFNDGYSTLPWYNTSVSGSDSDVISLTQVEDGVLIEGDNLQDVEVTVKDDNEATTLTLTTEKDSAMIVSLEDDGEDKAVILLDADDDGDYETIYEPVVVPGDFNGDGDVTILDVLALLKHVAGISTVTGNADVSGDGQVNILDVLHLLKFVARIIPSL